MEILVTLGYALNQGQQIDRFVLTPSAAQTTEEIRDRISPFKVRDVSIICDKEDDDRLWGEFLEYRSDATVVYEIPRKYTDAFNLYVKTLNAFMK